MNLKALAFDLDGTLYPEYRLIVPSLGTLISHPFVIYHFSKIRKIIRNVRPIHDYKKTQAELYAKRVNISVDEAYKKLDDIIYKRWIASIHKINPFKGLREALAEVKKKGYILALMSDLPVEDKLEYLEMNGLWDHAFSTEETGYLKPNIEPFKELIKRVGCKPGDIMYFGNNYHYDVIGASDAGMKTAHLAYHSPKDSIADIHLKTSNMLVEFLKKLPVLK